MRRLRIIVADDEPLARETLRGLLARHADVEVAAECANGLETVDALRKCVPDAVFLDVQMPGLDGFGVLENLAGVPLPLIVFVTAYDRYALKAFDVHAVDYLLKPFDDARFDRTLDTLRERVSLSRFGDVSVRVLDLLEERRQGAARSPWLARIAIRKGARVLFVRAEEIDWIEAEDYYVRLHVGDRSHLLRESMQSLEAKLDPAQFVRIHRSAIVNVDRVREIHPEKADYLVVLDTGTRMRMSRARRARLEQLFRR